MNGIQSLFPSLMLRRLGKDFKQIGGESVWMMSAYVVKSVLQTLSFVLLARQLKSSEYGEFVSVLAFMTILASFFDFGAYSHAMSMISRKYSIESVKYILLSLLFYGFLGMLLLVSILKNYIFPNFDTVAYYLLFAACIVGDKMQAIFMGVSLANSFSKKSAIFESTNWIVRFFLVILLVFLHGKSFEWSMIYSAQSIIMGFLGLFLLGRVNATENSKNRIKMSRIHFLEGCQFALGALTKSMSTDADKVILSRFVSPQSVAVYTIAYRFVNMAYLPLHALFSSTYQKFFALGQSGIEHSIKFALRLMPITVLYSLLTFTCIYFLSDFIDRLIGGSFIGVSVAVQYLAVLLVIQAIHQPLADAYSGAGKQGFRNALQLSITVLNIGINIILIPRYGWLGACISAILTSFIMLLLYCYVSLRDLRNVGDFK